MFRDVYFLRIIFQLERKCANTEEVTKRIENENDKLKKATERLTQLIESNDAETLSKEKEELFAVLVEISPVIICVFFLQFN